MAKKVAKPVESEGGNQQTPEHITKSDAVRRALAAGIEGPQEGTAWIQKEFGIELSPSHFSAVKATEKKKGDAPKGKPGRKPNVVEAGHAGNPKAGKGDGDLLDALSAMKPLIAQFGPDKVKKMVDLLK